MPNDNVDRFGSLSAPIKVTHVSKNMTPSRYFDYSQSSPPTRFAITMLSSHDYCLLGAKWLERFFSFSPKLLELVGHTIAQTVAQMINCLQVDLAAWNRKLQSLPVPHLV